jgi:hypothetical protein
MEYKKAGGVGFYKLLIEEKGYGSHFSENHLWRGMFWHILGHCFLTHLWWFFTTRS